MRHLNPYNPNEFGMDPEIHGTVEENVAESDVHPWGPGNKWFDRGTAFANLVLLGKVSRDEAKRMILSSTDAEIQAICEQVKAAYDRPDPQVARGPSSWPR